MLAQKKKGLFLDVGEQGVWAATASALQPPFVLERLQRIPLDSKRARLREFVASLGEGKQTRYQNAHCAVYPASRFVRRHTIESAAKAKEPAYFTALLSEQLKIDPAHNLTAVLQAQTGAEFDPQKPLSAQKELLLCGMSKVDIARHQETLVEDGVYPESLRLGTVNVLGGLNHYLNWKGVESPVLVLELSFNQSHLYITRAAGVDLCRPIPFGLEGLYPLIQSELGLRDEASARKLLFSDTFDFAEMGPVLLRRILKELQASAGFYEVQTGHTIQHLVIDLLPPNLAWIEKVLERSLGLKPLKPDYAGWLDARDIRIGESVLLDGLDIQPLGVFSLMGSLDIGSKEVAHAA